MNQSLEDCEKELKDVQRQISNVRNEIQQRQQQSIIPRDLRNFNNPGLNEEPTIFDTTGPPSANTRSRFRQCDDVPPRSRQSRMDDQDDQRRQRRLVQRLERQRRQQLEQERQRREAEARRKKEEKERRRKEAAEARRRKKEEQEEAAAQQEAVREELRSEFTLADCEELLKKAKSELEELKKLRDSV